MVKQLVVELGRSRQSVIRLFQNEPGVRIFPSSSASPGKRRYRTIIVPDHVLQRVLRLENPDVHKPSVILFYTNQRGF
jgi:hypothetical protein